MSLKSVNAIETSQLLQCQSRIILAQSELVKWILNWLVRMKTIIVSVVIVWAVLKPLWTDGTELS